MSLAHAHMARILAEHNRSGWPPEQITRVADELMVAIRDAVARGLGTAADQLDLPEHRALAASFPGHPADQLRRWAREARSTTRTDQMEE